MIMKKVKQLALLGVGLIISTSLFAGCQTDGLGLLTAFEKSQTITSSESQTNISVNVSATNLSQEEHQSLDSLLPFNTNISVDTKMNENQAKTASQTQEDINLNLGITQISTSLWSNEDFTGDKPVIQEIIKIPQVLNNYLPPALHGKDYLVLNAADISSDQATPQIDYKKLLSFTTEFQPKLLDFIGKYAKQFNPKITYINKSQQGNVYELQLNDASLKSLIRYTLNNLAENTDAIRFVTDYLSDIQSVYGIADTTQLKTLAANSPEELASLNKTLDSLNSVQILGSDGIKIDYTVNNQGYIVNEDGNAQFLVNLPTIIKLANTQEPGISSATDPTGIYTINLGFNTDITNINENMPITFPQVNATNSANYNDLINTLSTQSIIKK
jgi:hypothetical protein